MTMNGCGSECTTPSTVTRFSSMASSSADCVFGEVRFISSASRMLVITSPARYSKRFSSLSNMVKPVISDAMTSGVNCALRKLRPVARPSAIASVVLPTPGTSSMSTCPCASIAVRIS